MKKPLPHYPPQISVLAVIVVVETVIAAVVLPCHQTPYYLWFGLFEPFLESRVMDNGLINIFKKKFNNKFNKY
jgi:hypothetical protein